MDVNKILNADILDIIFEGRNKEYGAYDLRKTYNKRMVKAIGGTAIVIALLFIGFLVSNLNTGGPKKDIVVQDVQLEEVKEEKKEPPPPPPPKIEPPKVEMAKFTPPKIVPDKEVKPEEKPPEQEKLEDTKIGTVNQEGIKDEGITAPPVSDAGKGVVEAPKDNEDYDKTFTKVEIESEFPGGSGAWLRYLNKNLRYPDDAVNNEIQGTVIVQFIVDKEGNVSDVTPISGPDNGGLREEAVRVIKKSGKWTPAVQNGRSVKSYKKQPIVFKLEAQ
jgi:periplasmic protein TonB